mmetsp:Transcript_27690/g.45421  ORF Transcript_27690/g.45421 Transcript_27690/m.45421 type:complete len:136 (-) Transcript_27690:950-1357(-)
MKKCRVCNQGATVVTVVEDGGGEWKSLYNRIHPKSKEGGDGQDLFEDVVDRAMRWYSLESMDVRQKMYREKSRMKNIRGTYSGGGGAVMVGCKFVRDVATRAHHIIPILTSSDMDDGIASDRRDEAVLWLEVGCK